MPCYTCAVSGVRYIPDPALSSAPHLHAGWAEPSPIRHVCEPQAGRVVCGRAAVTAHQVAPVPALHAVADVAVHVGAVDQRAQLLERQVVVGQVGELSGATHLQAAKRHTTHDTRQWASIATRHQLTPIRAAVQSPVQPCNTLHRSHAAQQSHLKSQGPSLDTGLPRTLCLPALPLLPPPSRPLTLLPACSSNTLFGTLQLPWQRLQKQVMLPSEAILPRSSCCVPPPAMRLYSTSSPAGDSRRQQKWAALPPAP